MPVADLEHLRSELERLAPVALAAELVRIPSHPGIERQEEGVARALARWLGSHGIAAELTEVAPGRPNLVARVDSGAPGPRLLLCGHTDTVPLNAGDAGRRLLGRAARRAGSSAAAPST